MNKQIKFENELEIQFSHSMLTQRVCHHGFNPQLLPKANRNMKWKDIAYVKSSLDLSYSSQLNNSIKSNCKKLSVHTG